MSIEEKATQLLQNLAAEFPALRVEAPHGTAIEAASGLPLLPRLALHPPFFEGGRWRWKFLLQSQPTAQWNDLGIPALADQIVSFLQNPAQGLILDSVRPLGEANHFEFLASEGQAPAQAGDLLLRAGLFWAGTRVLELSDGLAPGSAMIAADSADKQVLLSASAVLMADPSGAFHFGGSCTETDGGVLMEFPTDVLLAGPANVYALQDGWYRTVPAASEETVAAAAIFATAEMLDGSIQRRQIRPGHSLLHVSLGPLDVADLLLWRAIGTEALEAEELLVVLEGHHPRRCLLTEWEESSDATGMEVHWRLRVIGNDLPTFLVGGAP